MQQLINLKRTSLRPDQYIYIGRPSIWGNPFMAPPLRTHPSFQVGSRAEAIQKYDAWIREQPALLTLLPELAAAIKAGKPLACHCAPLACHGGVLIMLLYERELL